MDTIYTVFTHLLDPLGQIRGQKDNPPDTGKRPTTGWAEGEVVVDTYAITVDPDAPPGAYTLETGMYDLATMQRLPAFDEDGQPLPGAAIPLGQIEVTR
jgi:hypothetical protein